MPPADAPGRKAVRRKSTGGALGIGNLAAGVRKVAKPKTQPAPPPRPVRAPHTDVQTGGPRQIQRANEFKRTPTYKRAVRAAKQANRQQLAARYTHTGPAKQTIAPKQSRAGLIAAALPPVGIVKSLAHGDIVGAVASANPAAPILKIVHPTGAIATNAAKDLVNTPATVVPSTVHLASQAAHGRVKEVAGELAQPYIHLAQHPVHDIVQHPLNSYLLFEGVKGGVGRTTGRAMRAAPEGSAIERAASTRRAPATAEGTDLVQTRRYSPDVTIKARQVLGDKRAARKVRKLNTKAAAARSAGDEETAIRLEERAAKTDPTRMSDAEIKRRLSETVDANEIQRRLHRTAVTQQVDKAIPKGKGAAVSLTAQRITSASKEDLLAYRSELEREHANLSGAKARANRLLRQQITRAVKGNHDPAAIEQAARDYQQITAPLQAKLADAGLYDSAQMERRALAPYAVRHMGATHDGERIVAADGSTLSNDQIRAHMAAHDVSEPAYVTQAPSQRGPKNFYVSQHRPPSVSRAKYTGAATREGTFDAHPDVLKEGAARMQGLVDAHEGFKRIVHEFGRKQNGQLVTKPSKVEADKVVRDLNAKPGTKWQAIRINPFAGRAEQLKALVDHGEGDAVLEHPDVHGALEDAAKGKDGPGPWAIVPKAAADELQAHIRTLGSGGAGKAFQLVNTSFRKTVLSTSPKWLTGNTVEAGLRAAISRAGPRSYYTGRLIQKALDAAPGDVGEQYAARVTQGGHYSMADRMPRRSSEQFQGTRIEPLANALGAFWRTPGPKQLAGVWHGWTQFVFHTVNGTIERQFQTAMAGAHIRRNLMTGKMLKLSDQAIRDAAEGLKDTNAQVELGRAVDRMYGQYGKFSPGRRQVIALYTPFIAWSLNAARFVLDVLPRDHPVATSVMASATQATEEWRKQQGLDEFIKGALPGFLQGTVPSKGGGHIPAARYTPFGAFTDIGSTAGDAVLPQFSGVLAALKGTDWKGAKLTGAGGQPANQLDKARAAAEAFAESTIPLLGTAQQVAKKGPLGVVNPVAPYKSTVKKKAARSKGVINWSGSGGGSGTVNWGGAAGSTGSINWGG